jgi:hypothetical protein
VLIRSLGCNRAELFSITVFFLHLMLTAASGSGYCRHALLWLTQMFNVWFEIVR